MYSLRVATELDQNGIRNVHLHAFPMGEAQVIATLAANLLSQATNPETFSFVAEINGTVVGHIAFSPVTFDPSKTLKGYILAPLAVIPEYQNRKIGSKLIKAGIEQLSNKGINLLFVYGDPKYYGKFGFNAETATNYLPPYELQYPFGWQALVINEAVSVQQANRISCVPSLQDPALW